MTTPGKVAKWLGGNFTQENWEPCQADQFVLFQSKSNWKLHVPHNPILKIEKYWTEGF